MRIGTHAGVPEAPSELDNKTEKSSKRLQSLDCLRAVACLFVVFAHTSGITIWGGWSIGSHGVTLFCVLSGYLITSLLLAEEQRQTTIDVIGFWQRRCLRIVPAYFMVLIFCSLLMKTGLFFKNHPELISKTLDDFPYYATFTHNSGDGFALNQLWSISIEEQFYCLLPILLLLIRNTLVRQTALGLALVWLSFFVALDHNYNAAFIPLISGTLLAFNFNKISTVLDRSGPKVALLISAILLSVSLIFHNCPYGLLNSIAFVLLVWCAVKHSKPSPHLMALSYLGTISYGVYLVHTPIRLAVFRLLEHFGMDQCGFAAFALTTCISVPVAAISWEFFEKRILALRPKIEGKPVGIFVGLISPILICLGLILAVRNFR